MSAIGRYRPFQPHKYPKTVRFNAYSVHISASTVAGGCDGSCNRFFCVVLISSDAETTVPAHSSGNEATFSLEFCGQRQFKLEKWRISIGTEHELSNTSEKCFTRRRYWIACPYSAQELSNCLAEQSLAHYLFWQNSTPKLYKDIKYIANSMKDFT